MSWITLVSRAGIAAIIGSTLLVSTSVFANSPSISDDHVPREVAEALVEEYRELRRNCAYMTGEQRKACFHELRATNGEYRVAKQQLKQDGDSENIHLVTF